MAFRMVAAIRCSSIYELGVKSLEWMAKTPEKNSKKLISLASSLLRIAVS